MKNGVLTIAFQFYEFDFEKNNAHSSIHMNFADKQSLCLGCCGANGSIERIRSMNLVLLQIPKSFFESTSIKNTYICSNF
jgi:hypothetical protein